METILDTGDPLPWHGLFAQVFAGPSFTSYAINFAVLVVLLLLTAVVAGSEVAFFSLSSDERARCRESDYPSEQRIIRLLDKPQLLLATLLIFTNLLNITFVTITAILTKEALGTEAEGLLGLLIQTVGVTFVIVFFGELIPKVWANQNNLRFLKITAPLIDLATMIFKPISIPLLGVSNLIEKRIQRRGYSISVDELNHALEITTGQETSLEQKEILRGIVNFSSIAVRQIMRSRMDITAFDIELDFHELMDKINKSGYSRVPVFRDTIDKIEGIVYIKDLLPHIDKDEYFKWQALIRTPYFVPESKKIDDLLQDFQEKRVHMAVVVNEYGETEGLVTMEDIIEEIVGDIKDEFDEDEIGYTKIDNYTYVFEGKTLLTDFCKVLNLDFNTFEKIRGESESLGGMLLELFGRLPNASEETNFGAYTFRVVSADNKRIKKVRVTVQAPESEDQAKG